jgi:hypothetical protein
MPTQTWEITLQPGVSKADCWFFREQPDVHVEVLRLDRNANIILKAEYRTSPSIHQTITIEIRPGQPPFYAVMTELKIIAARPEGGEGAQTGAIQVAWPYRSASMV